MPIFADDVVETLPVGLNGVFVDFEELRQRIDDPGLLATQSRGVAAVQKMDEVLDLKQAAVPGDTILALLVESDMLGNGG